MKLEKYKRELIKKYFPELSSLNIPIFYKKMKDTHLEVIYVSQNEYLLMVNPYFKKASKKVLLGGIAHELAHVYIYYKMGFLLSKLTTFLYNHFSFVESFDERLTDRLVIKRGLGKELLAFVRYINKIGEKYTKEDGLTEEEIKALLSS